MLGFYSACPNVDRARPGLDKSRRKKWLSTSHLPGKGSGKVCEAVYVCVCGGAFTHTHNMPAYVLVGGQLDTTVTVSFF